MSEKRQSKTKKHLTKQILRIFFFISVWQKCSKSLVICFYTQKGLYMIFSAAFHWCMSWFTEINLYIILRFQEEHKKAILITYPRNMYKKLHMDM